MTTKESTDFKVEIEYVDDEPEVTPRRLKEDHAESCKKTEDQPLKKRLRTRQIKVHSENDDDLDVLKTVPRKKTKMAKKKIQRSTDPPSDDESELKLSDGDDPPRVKSRSKSSDGGAPSKGKGRLDIQRIYSFACRKCGQRFKHMGWLVRHEEKHKYISASLREKSSSAGSRWQVFCDDDVDELMSDEDIDLQAVGKDEDINLNPVVTTPKFSKTGKSLIVLGDEDEEGDEPQPTWLLEAAAHQNHAEQNSTQKRDLPPAMESSSCSICSHHFSSKKDKLDHVCNVLSCDKCSRAFKSQDALTRHIELHGSDSSAKVIFDCESCGRVFKQKSHLLLHNRHTHKMAVIFY